MWLWHGNLYCVSPFQIYCTSTSCLPFDLRIFHVFTAFSGNECWEIYKFDTNERVGVFLTRRSVQHLVISILQNILWFYFRSERKQWATGLFLGCTVLYSCRTVTPLCVAVMAKEFDWDKTQTVRFLKKLKGGLVYGI